MICITRAAHILSEPDGPSFIQCKGQLVCHKLYFYSRL